MISKRTCWTNEEMSLLRIKYEIEGLGWSEIVSLFPNRSIIAIHIKCKKMKLKHTPNQINNLRSRIHSGQRNGMFGKLSPFKGLNKKTSDFIATRAIAQSKAIKKMISEGKHWGANSGDKNHMYGKPSWTKGQTKHNNPKIANAAVKQSKAMKIKWENLSEDEKELRRIQWSSASNKCKGKRTTIEIIVEKWLNEIEIDFKSGKPIGRFFVDFYIPSLSTAIECDGDYWHCNPLKFNPKLANSIQKKNMERDVKKKIFLLDQGIKVINLWETDIRNGNAKESLIQFLKQ